MNNLSWQNSKSERPLYSPVSSVSKELRFYTRDAVIAVLEISPLVQWLLSISTFCLRGFLAPTKVFSFNNSYGFFHRTKYFVKPNAFCANLKIMKVVISDNEPGLDRMNLLKFLRKKKKFSKTLSMCRILKKQAPI